MKKSHGWEGGPDEPILLDSKEAVNAARFYAALKPFACGDFFNTDAPLQTEQLLSGRVAMGLVWSDYLFGLVNAAEARKQAFGFAPAPGGKSLIGGGSYYVNRRSQHPDIAAEFVAYLLRPENQVELAKRGLCSPVRATYANSEVRRLPYTEALGASLERATYMLEAGPDSELVASRITEALQRIWKGERSEAVLPEVQKRLTADRAAVFAQRGR
jgi:ABC-type glycerol-3-phosphate transport system substrate-binding protein